MAEWPHQGRLWVAPFPASHLGAIARKRPHRVSKDQGTRSRNRRRFPERENLYCRILAGWLLLQRRQRCPEKHARVRGRDRLEPIRMELRAEVRWRRRLLHRSDGVG